MEDKSISILDHGITILGSEIEPQSLSEEFTRTVSSNDLIQIAKRGQFLFCSEAVLVQSDINPNGILIF
jgi:hypothetical protein